MSVAMGLPAVASFSFPIESGCAPLAVESTGLCGEMGGKRSINRLSQLFLFSAIFLLLFFAFSQTVAYIRFM
jgi:hypothetical protein